MTTQKKQKKLQLLHKWIGLLSGSALFLLLFFLWSRSNLAQMEKKIKKESIKAVKLRKILKEKGFLLFTGPSKKKKNTQDLPSLVEKVVKEAGIDKWMVRIQPLQGLGQKKSVRLVFQGIPLGGVVKFFLLLRRENLEPEQQVVLNLMGRGQDRWRAVVTLQSSNKGL